MTTSSRKPDTRHIGLLGATGVGIGAIVGGGIMVLAGVAYQTTGPSAVLAFAINGAIAFLTAMSFAEMSSAFPHSGGPYMFAKKVLSVHAAFAVGWIVWFAYIVAGALYALGFASFTVLAIDAAGAALGLGAPEWGDVRRATVLFATVATVVYTLSLIRSSSGGGQWATVGKVVVFAVLILAAAVALFGQTPKHISSALSPVFPGGGFGLVATMGFTFIALQGFDLVSAVAGEIERPRRNIHRAMFLSLAVALAIYIPLLILLAIVGVRPGESIAELARQHGDTVFAVAVRRFLGPVGFWLVIVAAILSTLSALHANLLAASRVALAMGRDRTLPPVLSRMHEVRQTPAMALYASALALIAILFMVSDLASAGAAASLIFLIAFALAHMTALLARRRTGGARGYQSPWFPLVPVVGGTACLGLALFQIFVVPSAAAVTAVWLGLGSILYIALFQSSAETADASAEALDPSLGKMRGKRPLMLLPIANPASARSLVQVANAIAPSEFARVLLLTIVSSRNKGDLAGLADAQRVVGEALERSYAAGHTPEALITLAAEPWAEIKRVAKEHECASLLLGLREVAEGSGTEAELEGLMNEVDCDVAIMRATASFELDKAERILVPIGGRGKQHGLRARLLGSICRTGTRQITFVSVVRAGALADELAAARRDVGRLAEVNLLDGARVEVVASGDPAVTLIDMAADHDLIILGLGTNSAGRRVFGTIPLRIARSAHCPSLLISSRPTLGLDDFYRPLRDAASVIPWRGRAPR